MECVTESAVESTVDALQAREDLHVSEEGVAEVFLEEIPSYEMVSDNSVRPSSRLRRRGRRGLDSPSERIPEVKDCDFMVLDEPKILRKAREGLFHIIAFSKIRHNFRLQVEWNNQDLASSHVLIQVLWNDSGRRSNSIEDHYDVQTDQDFMNLLKSALKKVWLVHECVHCTSLIFNDETECESCQSLSFVTYHDKECIVCKESVHPIIFRCVTCVESQICVRCEVQRNKQNTCAVCRRPNTRNHLRGSWII